MFEMLAWCADVGGCVRLCLIQWVTTISLANEMVILFDGMIFCVM